MTAKLLEKERKDVKTKPITSVPNWVLSIRGLVDDISDRKNGKGRVGNMINILYAQHDLRIREYETVYEKKIKELKHEIANQKSALDRRLSSASTSSKARAHGNAVAIAELENKIALETDQHLRIVEQVKKNTAVKETAYLRFVDSRTRKEIAGNMYGTSEVVRNETV